MTSIETLEKVKSFVDELYNKLNFQWENEFQKKNYDECKIARGGENACNIILKELNKMIYEERK